MLIGECIANVPQPRRDGESCALVEPLRILLVEDNPADVALTEHRIAACCGNLAEVVQVDSLVSALLSLASERFDVVLLDMTLPGSEGLDSVIMILQQALATPVIVLSGDEDEATATEAIRLGAQDYVRKSRLGRENLRRIMTHAIERHGLRLALERRISALERKRQNFRSLIADNADAMIVVDAGGTIRFANAAAELLLERSRDSLIETPFGIPIEGIDASELELCGKGGAPLVVDMRVMRTTWEQDPAYVATLRDVTDRKENERMLRVAKQSADMASRIKGQFLANVSHELRTPLNAVIGFSDLLLLERHGAVGSPRYKGYLHNIRKSAEELSDLVDRLLDLSKVQAGALELEDDRELASELLEGLVEELSPLAERAGLSLRLGEEAPQAILTCDAERVRQSLRLLISNSLKFTPQGGTIELSAVTTASGELEITVADSGIGMPHEQVLRAFASFEEPGAPYAAQPGKGAGLGLALAKALAELHGGKLCLDSQPGDGTRVRIVFPRHRVFWSDTPRFEVSHCSSVG